MKIGNKPPDLRIPDDQNDGGVSEKDSSPQSPEKLPGDRTATLWKTRGFPLPVVARQLPVNYKASAEDHPGSEVQLTDEERRSRFLESVSYLRDKTPFDLILLDSVLVQIDKNFPPESAQALASLIERLTALAQSSDIYFLDGLVFVDSGIRSGRQRLA